MALAYAGMRAVARNGLLAAAEPDAAPTGAAEGKAEDSLPSACVAWVETAYVLAEAVAVVGGAGYFRQALLPADAVWSRFVELFFVLYVLEQRWSKFVGVSAMQLVGRAPLACAAPPPARGAKTINDDAL
mmetsp:Transcript_28523/g.96041  ORF Transcript_28523/g.96041 Transcript_28523/m.96041 type:complete len:130 (+) Transcript_28523:54-443(+)